MLIITTGKHEEEEDKRSETLKEYITGNGQAILYVMNGKRLRLFTRHRM